MRAARQPGKQAYRFLEDGAHEESLLTFQETDRRARALGAVLQTLTRPGDRALMLFPPGLDFITTFFACLYARVLAVPAYPPHPARLRRHLPVIQRIIADAQPSIALMNTALWEVIDASQPTDLAGMKLLAVDREDWTGWADRWQEADISGDDIAFLQYTSGSTTTPKGVMVTHGNLLHNMAHIAKCYGIDRSSHGVLWLPPYHDMGLIGGILQPVFSGASATLMPHLRFLQNPFRWLHAISKYKASINGAPNFAYNLCVQKIKPEQRDELDLSCWDVAFNGAEPVYHKTLEEFADFFAPCGFRREAFLPCYGLAESTLLVTGGPRGKAPRTLNLVKSGLELNKVILSPDPGPDTQTLVSCGHNISDQEVRVVDPETHIPCAEEQIGEIWVKGPSVTRGYWQKPEETRKTFAARLAGGEAGPFLRSGDLGFIKDGEFYITGRIKNLIISDGKNHYPHDLERTMESAHAAIRPAGCAAFSLNHAESERIVAVAEVGHRLRGKEKQQEVIRAIRRAINEQHGLQLADVRLAMPGAIPRTTSGKIRHFLCKQYYLEGTLKEITQI